MSEKPDLAPAAKKIWDRVYPLLGPLSPLHHLSLERYCRAAAEEAALDRSHFSSYVDYDRARRLYERIISRYEDAFGLVPPKTRGESSQMLLDLEEE